MIDYIKPGCPYQNAYIERFNRTYRDDVLDCYIFNNLNEVKQITEDILASSQRLTRMN
ncbi:integrase core domain-containing protein [Pseudidiomarina tainanensis]|uniref:integrase core domain-containing protein n=1 Tax=Pseudidiomarina tainanensis TaxID=502365 RepID=UPI00389AC510